MKESAFTPRGSYGRSAAAAVETYAGFWRRFFALGVDNLLLLVLWVVLFFPVHVIGFLSALFAFPFQTLEVEPGLTLSVFGPPPFFFLMAWLYFALLESSRRGATPGKRLLGLRVADDATRQSPSFGQASLRYFLKIPSAMILMIGFVLAAFTEKKQALHDLVAKTVILHRA